MRCSCGRSDRLGQIVSRADETMQSFTSRVCFQVPAIALEHGITLVISPLIGELPLLRVPRELINSTDERPGLSASCERHSSCYAI